MGPLKAKRTLILQDCGFENENVLPKHQAVFCVPDQDGSPVASPLSHCPHKAFWLGLSASLLLILVALGLTGHLRLSRLRSQVHVTTPTVPTPCTLSGFI